jgi:hypothetical protein
LRSGGCIPLNRRGSNSNKNKVLLDHHTPIQDFQHFTSNLEQFARHY